jgi:archaellum component FlaC
MGLVTPVSGVVRSVGAAVDRLDRILSSLETLGGSIASIEHDMRGMRSELREAITGIDALRGDVQNMDGSVDGIREATVGLQSQLEGLGKSLKRIDALVPRLRRSRAEHTAS